MAKAKMPKGEKVKRMIEFKLTADQKADKGLEAAKLSEEIGKVTYEKKAAADAFAAKLKDRTGRMTTLLREINRGVEKRETECIEFKNFDANRVEYWADGKKLHEREMTEQDRQLDLQAKKTNAKGTTKADPKWQGAAAHMPAPKPSTKADQKSAEIRTIHREETSQKGAYSQLNGPRT
jgi:hypothetical protein